MRTVLLITAVVMLIIPAGCQTTESTGSLRDKIKILTQEKAQLQQQLEQTQAQTEQLKKQVKTLSGLTPELRLENLYDLQNIKVGRYTDLYDKDKDGKKETLIVYLQPIDENGDVVKAAGSVDVQLWDLSRKADDTLLAQWQVGPEELRKLWFATIVTINYRLTFNVADKVSSFDNPLTVKVTFTDYLTGKVFSKQKVIKP